MCPAVPSGASPTARAVSPLIPTRCLHPPRPHHSSASAALCSLTHSWFPLPFRLLPGSLPGQPRLLRPLQRAWPLAGHRDSRGHGGQQGTRGRAVPHQSSRSAAGTQSVPDPDPTAKDAGLGAEGSWGPSGAASSVPREDTPSPGSAAMAMGRARCSEPRVTRVSHQGQNCPPAPGHSSLSCWSLAQKLLPMGLGKPWDDERPGTVSCLSFPLVKSSLPTL